jgi:GxxExxY protein
MNADGRRYPHEDTTQEIIGVFFDVYNELGYGFLESVYRKAMAIALRSEGLQVEKEFPMAARFRGETVGAFKADLVVSGAVVRAKRCEDIGVCPHEAQILNYLRASVLEVGLLLNFGPKPQVKRLFFFRIFVNTLDVSAFLGYRANNLRSSAFICVHQRLRLGRMVAFSCSAPRNSLVCR